MPEKLGCMGKYQRQKQKGILKSIRSDRLGKPNDCRENGGNSKAGRDISIDCGVVTDRDMAHGVGDIPCDYPWMISWVSDCFWGADAIYLIAPWACNGPSHTVWDFVVRGHHDRGTKYHLANRMSQEARMLGNHSEGYFVSPILHLTIRRTRTAQAGSSLELPNTGHNAQAARTRMESHIFRRMCCTNPMNHRARGEDVITYEISNNQFLRGY